MSFTLTEEQVELTAVVADFLDKRSPESDVRRLMDAGAAADPGVWSLLSGHLGLAGFTAPESYGGGGFSWRDFVLVAERTGMVLLVAPLLATVSASAALVLSDDDALKAEHLPALAAGEKVGTLAIAEESGRWDAESVETTAVPGHDGEIRLTGTKMYVVDGQYADLFVVAAKSTDGPVGLYLADAHATGVAVTPLQTLDPTRAQARIEFVDTPVRPLAVGIDPAALTARVLAIATILLAAEQVGGAQRCLDMAVEYAKVRVQFGRPIGSFQAIKHKCANMLLDVESARSAAYYAAGVLDDGGEDVSLAAALAKAHCSAAYTRVAAENIQIHGGIGFTWEHPAHLYFKRAKTAELLFGDPAWQRERLAALVGI